MTVTHLNPATLHQNPAFSQGTIASAGRTLYVGEQNGTDAEGRISGGLAEQTAQALRNVLAVLDAGGARSTDIVRMTWYLANTAEYNARLGEIGAVYRDLVGHHYPAMSAVQVAGFVEDGAKVEIEVTAVLADD